MLYCTDHVHTDKTLTKDYHLVGGPRFVEGIPQEEPNTYKCPECGKIMIDTYNEKGE